MDPCSWTEEGTCPGDHGGEFEIHSLHSTDYRYAEALVELFASASWCLIAYEPRFFQGSGLLAQSLVAGTPVLCSRFPHAEELFARFGRLGELFSFSDMNDFGEAWSRLRNWTSEQWDEFHEAKRLFADAVNSERTTRKVIEYFAPSNAKSRKASLSNAPEHSELRATAKIVHIGNKQRLAHRGSVRMTHHA